MLAASKREERRMAVVFIQEFPLDPSGDRSTDNYDTIAAKIGAAADPPSGLIVHTAGFDEDAGVFRILDVWRSRAEGQAYLDEHIMLAVREVIGDDLSGGEEPSREGWYELHDVIPG
jgi:hypothetical protein